MQQIPLSEVEHRNGTTLNGVNGMPGSPVALAPPMMMSLPAPAPANAEREGGMDLSAIWSAFRRRWFLALSLGFVFGIPAAVAAWFLAPAPFVAFAEVRLNSIATGFPGTANQTIQNFDIRKQAILKRATHPMLLSEAIRPPEVGNATLIREQDPHATTWLEENLSIKPVGMEYVRIELEGEHPEELALIVNSVADTLVLDVDYDMTNERTKRRSQLDKLITETKNALATKNTDLENLRTNLKVDPAEIQRRQSFLLEWAANLSSALNSIKMEKLKFQAQNQILPPGAQPQQTNVDDQIEKLIDTHVSYLGAAEDLDRQRVLITTQEKHIENLTEKLSETHPNIVAAKDKLANLTKQVDVLTKKVQSVREEIRTELLSALPKEVQESTDPEKANEAYEKYRQLFEDEFAKNEGELKDELAKIKVEQDDLERASQRGAQITREIERLHDKLEGHEEELEKLQFEIDNTPTVIETSRKAEVPHTRSLKKKVMLSGVAGFGVFGVFVAAIVFLEYRTQRIGSINQVSEKLNLRVMGAVPLLPRSVSKANTVKKKAKNALWYSALTEAVDATRTLLLRGSQIESLKTVMVASAVGGEGKTTMASHLATSLARGGRKILLIDCDLRRPCVHRAFDLPIGKGVCEILRGEADVAECIQELSSPQGLSVLPAGKINQQVLKLLALDSFGEMLEPLKQQFDFIIVDSSPLLPVTDGLLVAQHADGVILSIRRDVSRISKVIMACQKLSMLGIPLLGAVTIGLEEESGYQSKYGYNYYTYGHRQHYYTQPPPV